MFLDSEASPERGLAAEQDLDTMISLLRAVSPLHALAVPATPLQLCVIVQLKFV